MEPALIIRDSITEVQRLQGLANSQPSLSAAVIAVKQFQSRRLLATYADMLTGGPYQAPATFFLTELYGNSSYSSRDSQFARIAGAIERLLPEAAVATAVCLAQLHVLTEQLDLAMGRAWLLAGESKEMAAHSSRYAMAWRLTGQEDARRRQLSTALAIGQDLDRLTRTPGMRLLLKVMRAPARAAGLAELQRFLERGFDTFAALGRKAGATNSFLRSIEQRETAVLEALFAEDPTDADKYLAALS